MQTLLDALTKFKQNQQRQQSERRAAETRRLQRRRANARRLHLQPTTYLSAFSWACVVTSDGFTHATYTGKLPIGPVRSGSGSANLWALNQAARFVTRDFPKARVETLSMDAEHTEAARLLFSKEKGARWAA